MTSTARKELEALVHERADAVARRDREALLGQAHSDVLDFGVLPPAASRGRDGTEKALAGWFDGYAEGPRYAPHVIQAVAEGDLGWVAYFYRVTGTLRSGDEVDMWVRATLVCRRDASGWTVVHGHESVPFDAATGQALLGEAPPADGSLSPPTAPGSA